MSTGKPISWKWDFGDGDISWQQNPNHTYIFEGSYTVTLTAINEFGYDTIVRSNFILVQGLGVPCPSIPTFTYHGQTYNTILIGTQCWMKENLNWETENSWCYNNDSSNCHEYGRLYNFQDAINACPSNWHLPTDDEWKELEMYLGMGASQANESGWRGWDEGKKLKSTSGWYSTGNGTDNVGFKALPGGVRNYSGGGFSKLGRSCFWWTASGMSGGGWTRELSFDNDKVYRIGKPGGGFSVRCVKN